FPNIPTDQRSQWDKQCLKLAKLTVPFIKFGVVGRTGSGKSTLINSLLGFPVLPTSAAVACTAAVTEIRYEDSNQIRADIFFMPEKQAAEVIQRLLDEIRDSSDSLDSTAFKSKEKLISVYLTQVTSDELLQADPVRSYLGTCSKIPPSCSDNFRATVEQYVSSYTSFDSVTLWPLVEKVAIYGKFSILSSGIILADLPGHGDDDEIRNNIATQYIKDTDGIILVADVKRIQSDRDTLSYLRKTLTQLVIDGLSPEEYIIVVATANDTLIADHEIKLEKDDHTKVDQLTKKLKELRECSRPRKKQKTTKTKTPDTHGIEAQMRLQQDIALIRAKARNGVAAKTSLQAHFQQLYSELTSNFDRTPQLPIFCVGSQDYLALTNDSNIPTIFIEEDDTEVPKLLTHMRVSGEHRLIKASNNVLNDFEALLESIHSYFSEGRHSGQLKPESKKMALDLIANLEKVLMANFRTIFFAQVFVFLQINLGVAENTFEAIDNEVAAEDGPRVVTEFNSAGMHFKTYQACMRYNGVFRSHNINRELTRTILPAIQTTWNSGLNVEVPKTLGEATMKFEKETVATLNEIIEVLNGQGTAFYEQLNTAKRSLNIEGLYSERLYQSRKSISLTQRDATRSFATILQRELTPQYQVAFSKTGRGCFQVMKECNVLFLEQNGTSLFNIITSHIGNLLDSTVTKIKHEIRNGLSEITTILRLTLVEETNLCKEDREAKDRIIQATLEIRPGLATNKLNLVNLSSRIAA
ncbi:hypothetical protein GGX14DRAFT_460247, partial [Mycena pura]